MSKIIKDKDYGWRRVITVTTNPSDQEAVHVASNGTKSNHSGAKPAGTPADLATWEWCPSCVYNWNTQEFVWTGDEMKKKNSSGNLVAKTDADYEAEVKAALVASPAAADGSLLNKTV